MESEWIKNMTQDPRSKQFKKKKKTLLTSFMKF